MTTLALWLTWMGQCPIQTYAMAMGIPYSLVTPPTCVCAVVELKVYVSLDGGLTWHDADTLESSPTGEEGIPILVKYVVVNPGNVPLNLTLDDGQGNVIPISQGTPPILWPIPGGGLPSLPPSPMVGVGDNLGPPLG